MKTKKKKPVKKLNKEYPKLYVSSCGSNITSSSLKQNVLCLGVQTK